MKLSNFYDIKRLFSFWHIMHSYHECVCSSLVKSVELIPIKIFHHEATGMFTVRLDENQIVHKTRKTRPNRKSNINSSTTEIEK